MVERQMIDPESEMVMFCLSALLMIFCKIGMERFINAWNYHHQPLRGIPNLLQSQRNGTTAIHPSEIPSVEQAAQEYRQQGGSIADPQPYGSDPLQDDELLIHRRDELFSERVDSDFSYIFNCLLVGNKAPFGEAILQFISITEELTV